MKRALKIAVLMLFVGFQAAQALHSHTTVSLDHCQTCQVLQHTPTVGAADGQQLVTRLVFQRLFVSRSETHVPVDVVAAASIRAPPAL